MNLSRRNIQIKNNPKPIFECDYIFNGSERIDTGLQLLNGNEGLTEWTVIIETTSHKQLSQSLQGAIFSIWETISPWRGIVFVYSGSDTRNEYIYFVPSYATTHNTRYYFDDVNNAFKDYSIYNGIPLNNSKITLSRHNDKLYCSCGKGWIEAPFNVNEVYTNNTATIGAACGNTNNIRYVNNGTHIKCKIWDSSKVNVNNRFN